MLTFRRSLIAAACILTVLFLLTRSESEQPYIAGDPGGLEQNTLAADSKSSKDDGSKSGKGYAPVGATTTSAPARGSGRKRPLNQIPWQDVSKLSLIDQLAYQFPYDVETKFPAYIWQTWKYTPASSEFGDEFRPAEASWTEKNPGFIHEVITDQVAVHLMRHLYASVPQVIEAYNSLPLAILKADFFRYLILLARGGVYSDIDTLALQSILEWIPESIPHQAVGLVIGIEADPDRPDWADWYSRRIQFCQWTIQAKPGHPVLREIVANITEETLTRKRAGVLKKDMSDDKVVDFTGPAVWTDTMFAFFNNPKYFNMKENQKNITWEDFTGMKERKKVGDVVVLPITSFSPGVKTMGSQDVEDPMAFVKHEFEGTWKPEHLRHIGVTDEELNAIS